MSLHECSMFEYQLEILDESKTNSIVLPKAGIGSLRNYFHGKTVSESVLEIDLNYINKLLKMPHFIILDIKLINKKEVSKVITSAARCLPPRTQSFDDALPNIKCNRCGTHLWQNIHFCSSGHNVCVDCRWKLERCNSCSGSWCLERNVAMERLASLLSYPCENRAAGCLYTAPMPYIVDHQARCLHKLILSRECYVKQCDYRGHNFITHITERHLLLETDEFYQVKDEKYFFLYNGDIIALELDFLIDIDLKYSVICCRSAEVKYQYELQLIDSPNVTKTNAKLTLKQVCQPEYTSLDPSQILTHVPFSLLSQLFLNCAKLMFKLKVFPID
ncbi:hypothetical protein HHI36_019142 [Cryptolaemus montrouzieri]|uniref:E3 ubiquitin-protein ligase n=1 Tax=Cryptolaemus montrouzieri TaxID=559131 RepID=A0ABD2P290_9CUCU